MYKCDDVKECHRPKRIDTGEVLNNPLAHKGSLICMICDLFYSAAIHRGGSLTTNSRQIRLKQDYSTSNSHIEYAHYFPITRALEVTKIYHALDELKTIIEYNNLTHNFSNNILSSM